MVVPSIQLRDGQKIPLLAFGTGIVGYKPPETGVDRELVENIKTAINAGFTHIDTAERYETETAVGIAIKESGVSRSLLFITTKVLKNLSDIDSAINGSLKALQLDYVDLYLIHTPFKFKSDAENQQAWAKMEVVKASGRARSIGVSNYQLSHFEAIEKTAKEMPAVNQVEYHPYLQRKKVPAYQKQHRIATEAYGPLTPLLSIDSGPLDEIYGRLAKNYGKTKGQIALRWFLETGVVAITRSWKQERIEEAIGTVDFQLTLDDVTEISAKGRELDFRRHAPDVAGKVDFE